MAEILALGITHYPPLMGTDERMAHILKKMLANPNLPSSWADPANWPDAMRKEWGDDEGAQAAHRHREALVSWMVRARAALDEFKPDFVLMWGDDQYENFKEDVIPPYCVNAHASFQFKIPQNNIWGEPAEKVFELRGAPREGRAIASALLEAGFDTAYSYKPLHLSLGHAFSNGVFYLDYHRRGFPYPILPISLNCYGRHVICQRGGLPQFNNPLKPDDLDPAAPTPWRLFDLGVATARILRKSPWKVAIVASSGWSHAFLTAKNHFLFPDTDADLPLFEALKAGNYQAWRNYSAKQVEDSGQQELLNWMCLTGALSELGRVPEESGFISTWIFNSSKAFLISRPDKSAGGMRA